MEKHDRGWDTLTWLERDLDSCQPTNKEKGIAEQAGV